MSGWIKVSSTIPEKGKILCSGPQGGTFVGVYKGGYTVDDNGVFSCNAWDTSERGAPRRFVFWQPLPEPPGEEE